MRVSICHSEPRKLPGAEESLDKTPRDVSRFLFATARHATTLDMTKVGEQIRDRRIFVLADTHNRLPGDIASWADGADEIWHLGDVCAESILDALRALGPPVTLVRGNCDSDSEWPLVVDLVRNDIRFRLQHIPPDRSPDGCDVLLHGHTHVPRNEVIGGVRFLNPGCVTRPNQGALPSVAFLEISADKELRWQLQRLR